MHFIKYIQNTGFRKTGRQTGQTSRHDSQGGRADRHGRKAGRLDGQTGKQAGGSVVCKL